MRFACGDMRDHIVSYQNDHRPSSWRRRALRQQARLRIDFSEIPGSYDFRLLQQYRHKADIGDLPDVRFAPEAAVHPESLSLRSDNKKSLRSDNKKNQGHAGIWCRPGSGWNWAWRILREHEGIVSGCEVNRLIARLYGERLPSIDLAHVDLSRGEQRPEQHGCGVC